MSKLIQVEYGQCTYLEPNDLCFYIMEYYSHKGYQHGKENSLIFNFKKGVQDNGQIYKTQAINTISQLLSSLFKGNMLLTKDNYIFIPIPPSKIKSDRNYDDRLVKVLQNITDEVNICYCDILDRLTTITSLHNSNQNRHPSMHDFVFNCDNTDLFKNKTLILLDDVITSGSTFNAAKNILLKNIPNIKIIGLFIARSVSQP